MKKLLYSLMTAVIALTSCTTWDDPKTENYGEGPSIEVSIAAVAPTDSAFVVSIVPGTGTTYYAFVMDANDEAETLDAATLLKGGYGNNVVNTSKYPSLTIPVDGMEPNTTYQVYAVASNEKGIIGKISVASIKTTDSGKPTFTQFSADASAKSATVTFNQAVARGEGKVSGVYFKEWDFENPVPLTDEDIAVEVSGKTMKLTAADVPAGAYLLFSWEEGTVVDATGNKCAAFESSVNPAAETVEDMFQGTWLHVANKNWSMSDNNVSSPKSGSTFPKWSDFVGEITFDDFVYVVEEDIKDGDFTVTYTNDSRTATYKLPVKNINFGLNDNFGTKKVTFTLPAATQPGDKVTLAIAEGVFKDVYGNDNDAFASKVYWISFAMTKEDVLGTFTFYATLSSGKTYSFGNFTIEEDAEAENGLVIKDFYLPGSVLKARYDIDNCKMYITPYEALGVEEMDAETKYGQVLYSLTYADEIECDVTSEGIVTSDLGIVAYDENFESPLGWYLKATVAMFVPAKSAAAPRRASVKKSTSKHVKKTRVAKNVAKYRK
jgi:hypothetical protein